MKNHLIALALMSLAAMNPASAQDFKPGLYEVTSKMGGNNKMGEMMKQQKEAMAKMTPEQRQQMADMPRMMEKAMESMSPEQRQKMKAMMGKQAGAVDAMQNMHMTLNADGTSTMKMCVTKEMVDQRNMTGNVGGQGGCTHNNGKMSGGVMKMSYTCAQPPSKGEGELRMTGPNSFTTKMTMVSTDPANKQTMELESTSTWLGADCGSVKPIDPKTFKQ